MAEESDLEIETSRVLARTTGLTLPADEMTRVMTLYERFAGDRATLAGAAVDEVEPVTIFLASRPDDRP